MSCEEIREELAAYIQGEIEGDRRTAIARHLENCAACQAEAASTREVIDGVAAADDAAVDRRWKQIVHDAIAARASDIHLLPGKGGMAVRFRIDGVLHEQEQLGMALGRAIVTALKVASECDATLVRSPQDGRIHIRHRDTNIDVRLSTMPT